MNRQGRDATESGSADQATQSDEKRIRRRSAQCDSPCECVTTQAPGDVDGPDRTSQESAKARQPDPTQARQQKPRGSDAFKEKHGYRATNSTTQVQFSRIGWLPPSLTFLFFPSVVYVWLYERVVLTRRRQLKPVAMLVPIFGGATTALIWMFLISAVVQLMD